MNETPYSILQKNIDRVQRQAFASAEKSFAHLHEAASLIAASVQKETGDSDLLHAILHSDEAARIYREARPILDISTVFAPVNEKEEPFFSRQTARLSRFYLCRCIAEHGTRHTVSDLNALYFDAAYAVPSGNDRKVAFLRNRQAFRAFECFAKTLGGVSVLYENNFQSACEAVEMGEATYAIIPVYSTSDGRLGSFYRMIEKYELSIVLTCDIDSDDGESMTTFALVYRDRITLAAGAPKMECKITFDDLSALSDVMDAAYYYGAEIESLEALPVMFSGRAGTYSVVFSLDGADIDGLVCYLALEYPQMSLVGIYHKAERNGKEMFHS